MRWASILPPPNLLQISFDTGRLMSKGTLLECLSCMTFRISLILNPQLFLNWILMVQAASPSELHGVNPQATTDASPPYESASKTSTTSQANPLHLLSYNAAATLCFLDQPSVISVEPCTVCIPCQPFVRLELFDCGLDSDAEGFQRNTVPNARSGGLPLRNLMLALLGYHVGQWVARMSHAQTL